MYIIGQHGLGDAIYLRAFIPRDVEVFLKTPWPEIYSDFENIKFVRKNSGLRTQRKNEANSKVVWHTAPDERQIKINYSGVNILKGIENSIGFSPKEFNLPSFGKRIIKEKYAVIRPVTVRKEWPASSRNPLPQYINKCAEILLNSGYTVISIADIDQVNEYAVGCLPEATKRYNKGELGIIDMLGIMENADVVVGGVGWIVPASIAFKSNAFIVFGGCGGLNHPDMITSNDMDLSKIKFVLPDNFCLCRESDHECNKYITGIESSFNKWLSN